jgi:uncharacterized membrane protein
VSLAPLLAAPIPVQLHALAAIGALLLGILQLARAKGDGRHRALGWAWVVLMAVVALSAFGITGVAGPGQLSWIHAIALYTLGALALAVLHARRGQVRAHRIAMLSLFFGALIITGAFTLLPGRIMHRVVFGG